MARFVDDAIIDRIRGTIDIAALVQEYVPSLKRAGSGFKGLCPFHNDTKPSMTVTPARQTFKCWSCNEGGDAFSFIMKIEGVSFPEALEMLAERAHVELPKRSSDGPHTTRDEKAQLYRANDWAARMYQNWLLNDPVGKKALDYLLERGVTRESIETFGLGYAPSGWTQLLDAGERKGIPTPLLNKVGLLSARREGDGFVDRFRDRVMFPIRDPRGRTIAFGARCMDGSEPKYLNSPETPLFSKSRTLYALSEAHDSLAKDRRAVVVEGYMDAIMAHQYGATWVVGVLGTALTRDHVRLLRRYVDDAVLLFDADNAGQNSADRSIDAFAAEELTVRVVALPDGLDPDDFLRDHGMQAFVQLLNGSVDGVTHKLDRALAAVPEHLRTSGAAVGKAIDDVLATVALMKNAVTQSLELRKIAERSRIPESALTRRIDRLINRRQYRDDRAPAAEPDPEPTGPDQRPAEYELLEAMLTYPNTIAYVRSRLDPEGLHDDALRDLVARLYTLAENGAQPTAADLLARTQEDDLRAVVEHIMGAEPKQTESPEQWCRELLQQLLVRDRRESSDAISRRLQNSPGLDRATRRKLMQDKLEAARAAHDARGVLKFKK